ncbi:MAG TPA: hypothetical protein VF784_00690 [Anaerolineales bacterium]
MTTTLHDHKLNSVSAAPRTFDGFAKQAGGFLWHFTQMVLAMEAGMMIYHKLIMPPLMGTGFGRLLRAYPLFGYWMMVLSMVLPMLALMVIYHRSTWQYCLGMTGAMVAPLAALTVLVLCSLCPMHILYGIGDPLMFAAMAVFMLVRPAHHTHTAHPGSCHAS